jgi:toxin ParE1/3/4
MIKRRPRAIYAIIDMAEYIGQSSPASAERFLDATEATFEQLEAMPGIGHLYESTDARLAEIRVWPVKGFRNHLIFYRPMDQGIEVLHVLHGARDIGAAWAMELGKGPL